LSNWNEILKMRSRVIEDLSWISRQQEMGAVRNMKRTYRR